MQTTTTLPFREQYRCTIWTAARNNAARLKQVSHLLFQLRKLKRRQWIQFSASRLHSRVNQRDGKWGSMLSDWEFRVSKHTRKLMFKLSQQLLRALEFMLISTTMSRPMSYVQFPNLLQCCKVHSLGFRELCKLRCRHNFPRTICFKHYITN